MYKKLKSEKPNSHKYITIKTNLKTYNTILKRSIRLAKIDFYHSHFAKYKNDAPKTWSLINSIMNRTKKNAKQPDTIEANDILLSDPLQIANAFNSYFVNIGPNLAGKIKIPKHSNHNVYLKEKYTNTFDFTKVDELEVNSIIDHLSPKTSYGFDGISTILLKQCKKAIIKPLQIIINQALTTGIFPDKLKIAKVQPIYKNEEQTLIKNYRPISLLPSISKVFEKIIFNQLYSFLQKQNIIYKSQYGFRREHSTEFAALELIDRVNTEMDNNEIPFNIYLDLSKAFDTLDHTILLDKLHYYGVRNTPLDLFKNYLTNRKQYVEIDSVKSKMGEIQTGVPQGSILGPLLFIIYINDIKTSTELFNVITYADDTTLMSTLGSFNSNQNQNSLGQNINEELNKISGWLKVNKLSLNAKKSKFMIFKRVNKTVKPLSLKIENTNIERVTNFNFLGLTISDVLYKNVRASLRCIVNTTNLCILCQIKISFLPSFLPSFLSAVESDLGEVYSRIQLTLYTGILFIIFDPVHG